MPNPTVLSDHGTSPSYDDFRYCLSWWRMAQLYGVEVTVDCLIAWYVLCNAATEQRGVPLVLVFGDIVEERAQILALQPPLLEDRFLLEGKNDAEFAEKVTQFCNLLIKLYHDYLLID